MSTKSGLFIPVDGTEGTGKTTQIARAAKVFGDRVLCTREPGGTDLAEKIRNLLVNADDAKTMFAMAWAARADHLKHKIIPALEAGKIVICDRFDSSTYAYQIIAQEGHELAELFWQMRRVYLGKTVPDLYVHFDIDPEIGIDRKLKQKSSDKNAMDLLPFNFHYAVRTGLHDFMKQVPSKTINTAQDEDAVWKEFEAIIVEAGRLKFVS